MTDVQGIDVEQIMKQVQENIRRRRQEPTLAHQTEYASNGQVTADLASLHTDHNIYSMHFTSHHRVLGPLIVSVKKTLRQLLTPILIKQASYNAANTRVVTHLTEQLAALEEQQRQVQGEALPQQQQALVALEGRLGRLEERQQALVALEGRLGRLEERQQALVALEGRLGRLEEQPQALVALEGRLGRLEERQQALVALQQQVGTISQPQEQALRIIEQPQALVALEGRLGRLEEQPQALVALEGRLGRLEEQPQALVALEGRLGRLEEQPQALVALEGRLGRLEEQPQALVALEERLGRLEEQQQALVALQQQVGTISQPQEQALRIMRERVSRAERKLRRILHTLTNGQEGEAQGSVERKPLLRQALEPEFDYCGFEDHFRGDEEEIKERQRRYLEYFKGAEQVLDVGCGRGEFLELLREVGIKAKGIDANLDMVLLCQEKGLDVIQGDALDYLEALSDASLDGIFAAQFIEHLPPNAIVSFVQLCHRKLKPNGVILLETPNPQCLTTMAWGFYLDFSHLWPCHPEAMRYLLESMRFRDVRLEFSAPVDAQASIPLVQDASLFGAETARFNRAAQRLNELIFGYQDYAVIGHRI